MNAHKKGGVDLSASTPPREGGSCCFRNLICYAGGWGGVRGFKKIFPFSEAADFALFRLILAQFRPKYPQRPDSSFIGMLGGGFEGILTVPCGFFWDLRRVGRLVGNRPKKVRGAHPTDQIKEGTAIHRESFASGMPSPRRVCPGTRVYRYLPGRRRTISSVARPNPRRDAGSGTSVSDLKSTA